MAELLKYVCVEEACRKQGEGTGNPTDSKVALLSGVHRKEVKRIREELAQSGAHDVPLRHGANSAAQLIALWMTHPDFQNEQGEPLCLPMRDDSAPSIEALAQLIKADMRPRTIVDDLIQAGVAEERADKICLLRSSYISDLPEDRLAFMANNVGDHFMAAVHNLEGNTPTFLEQALFFDELSTDDLELIRPELRRLGEKLLRDAYRKVAKQSSETNPVADSARARPSRRMRMGVYYFEDDTAEFMPEQQGSASNNTSQEKTHD